jgi:hypothetical protein
MAERAARRARSARLKSALAALKLLWNLEHQREQEMPPLTDRQEEAFAYWRALGFSQTVAARKAGFSATSAHNIGCRLAKDPSIRERIQILKEAQAPWALETGATREWIMTASIELVEACLGHGVQGADYRSALKTLEFLAQLKGYVPPQSARRG